jgi:hypothetical protein
MWKNLRRCESQGNHSHYILRYIKKQVENLKYFSYLCSMITKVARCTREIKARIAMAKAAFGRRRIFSPANWT